LLLIDAERVNQDKRPSQAVEQIEQDESQSPCPCRTLVHRPFEELPALGNHDRMDDQYSRCPDACGQHTAPYAGQEANSPDEKQNNQRRRNPILGVLAEQLVIERWPGAAGRRQAIARLPHILRGETSLHRRAFRGQGGKIGLFTWNGH
jgi:hypothetical protein